MLTKLGHFTVRRRRLVLISTVVFMVLAAVLGSSAFGVLKTEGFDDPASESTKAEELLERHFGGGEPNIVLVVTAEGRTVDDRDVAGEAAVLESRLARVEGVEQVVSYWSLRNPPSLRSTDGDTGLILARATGDEASVEAAIEVIRHEFTGEQGSLRVLFGGSEAVFADIAETIEGDLLRAELIAVPLTLILLLFVFRGLIAASLPLLVTLIAILGTFLALFLIGSVTNVSIYAINLTTALGIGLAIDYSLFIVSRFREELEAGRDVEGAVVRTVETAGKTILISALTVAVSLSALLVFPLYFLRSMAYSGTAVVMLALAGSLLALPSLLAMLGHRVNAGRIGRQRSARTERQGMWHSIATFVMRRPIPIATGVTALLLLLGIPFLQVNFGIPDDRVLPESAPSRQASEVLRTEFTGNTAEGFGIVVSGTWAAQREQVTAAAAMISSTPGVARVESAAGTHVSGKLVEAASEDQRFLPVDGPALTWISVVPGFPLASQQGEDLVRDIRALDLPVDISVGGDAAALVDTKSSIGASLPWAITIIVVATFVLLFLLSGSVLVPVKALLLNFLSLTATFGAMVWVFQDGNLSGLLEFTATGAVDISMPILMFCIAFGLSMDYEVFLLSRIKEEHDLTGDNEASVAIGLQRTGQIVTAAAGLIAITFFAFGTSGVSFIKLFGIGLGLAVLVDATVVRAFLVPAFMKLAGEANWWAPGPLRTVYQRFGISEAE